MNTHQRSIWGAQSLAEQAWPGRKVGFRHWPGEWLEDLGDRAKRRVAIDDGQRKIRKKKDGTQRGE